MNTNKSKLPFIAAAILVLVQFAAGFDAARKNSQTYDEAVHIAAGYSYWKTGDFRMNATDHPPFVKLIAAAPLALFLRPDFIPPSHPLRSDLNANQFNAGNHFLYKNRIPAERILMASRTAMLFMSALFSVGFFLMLRRLYDDITALFALLFWVFCPSVFANTFLVTTDFAAAAFYFMTFYFLYKTFEQRGKPENQISFMTAAISGITAGLALASKFSSILILPSVAIIWAIIFATGGNGYILKDTTPHEAKPQKTQIKFTNLTAVLVVFSVTAFLTIWMTYFFKEDISLYFDGLDKIISNAAGEKPRPAYLMGSRAIGGWRYYFLATLFLKTPLAVIIAAIIFIISALKNPDGKTHIKRDAIFWGIPSLIFFAAASFSKIQIGHRHILPVYPLLIIWAGAGVSQLIRRKKALKIIAALVMTASVIAEFFLIHPWQISYISSVVFPGAFPPPTATWTSTLQRRQTAGGEMYLLDSNFDWGQGLKDLSLYLKSQGVTDIYLSYFGSADPQYYGIRYYPIGFISNVAEREGSKDFDITRQKRKFIAISATNLYGVYYADTNVFSFFKKIPPDYRAGNSIFVYDLEKIPGAATALAGIIEKYLGDKGEAQKIKNLPMATPDKQ